MDDASLRHPPVYLSHLNDSPVRHSPSKVLYIKTNKYLQLNVKTLTFAMDYQEQDFKIMTSIR